VPGACNEKDVFGNTIYKAVAVMDKNEKTEKTEKPFMFTPRTNIIMI